MITTLRVTKERAATGYDKYYVTIGREATFGAPFQTQEEAETMVRWLLTAMPALITKLGEREVAEAEVPKGKNWQDWKKR